MTEKQWQSKASTIINSLNARKIYGNTISRRRLMEVFLCGRAPKRFEKLLSSPNFPKSTTSDDYDIDGVVAWLETFIAKGTKPKLVQVSTVCVLGYGVRLRELYEELSRHPGDVFVTGSSLELFGIYVHDGPHRVFGAWEILKVLDRGLRRVCGYYVRDLLPKIREVLDKQDEVFAAAQNLTKGVIVRVVQPGNAASEADGCRVGFDPDSQETV